VKRDRASHLLGQLLERLDGAQCWPLTLVDEVRVFGSYRRGALDPHDVDLAVVWHRDQRMTEKIAAAICYGGNPYAELRRALAGTGRGLQLLFEPQEIEQLEAEGAQMLTLWRRGDTLAAARACLASIPVDPAAGRASRDDMIDAFDGLDRQIPRPVRATLIGWQNDGLVSITRTELADAVWEPSEPNMRWAIERRWNPDSPLRRAAVAALAHLQQRGADLSDVELMGQRLPTPRRMAGHRSPAAWWVNWQWRDYPSIATLLAEGKGWLEVPRPTRTRPLTTLLLTPGPNAQALPGARRPAR